MERPWTDEDRLRELYWEQQMSQAEIARELNCSKPTIERWFRKFDIETQSQEDAQKLNQKSGDGYCNKKEHQWQKKSVLEKLYVEERKGVTKIANELGTIPNTIYKWLDKHNIETRSREDAETGPISPRSASRGDRQRGYSKITTPRSSVYVHQLVSIAHGASPEKVFSGGEHHVHHKNEIPWDNRPDNLSLVSRKDHVGHHFSYD